MGSHDQSIPYRPFPIGGPLEPNLSLMVSEIFSGRYDATVDTTSKQRSRSFTLVQIYSLYTTSYRLSRMHRVASHNALHHRQTDDRWMQHCSISTTISMVGYKLSVLDWVNVMTFCYWLDSYYYYYYYYYETPLSPSSSASWWRHHLLREGSTSRHPVLWADTSQQRSPAPWSVALCSHRVGTGDETRPHLCMLARHGPWPVQKQFNSVQEWRGRSKPGWWIVGSHTRWLLTTAADNQSSSHCTLWSTRVVSAQIGRRATSRFCGWSNT